MGILDQGKEMIARIAVKGKIRDIAKAAGIPPEKVYAGINVTKRDGDFQIYLYSKDDMTKPIREIQLIELIG